MSKEEEVMELTRNSLTNKTFLKGIRLLAGSLWAIFITGCLFIMWTINGWTNHMETEVKECVNAVVQHYDHEKHYE